jgi:hypothetical protein
VGIYGNANARVTCQAILKPTGEIIFLYKTLAQLGSNYTIGIQNAARDDGLLIAFNTLYAHDGLAIRVRPPGLETWLTLDATSGTVAPGSSQPIAVTLNASGLALGDYTAELRIDSNAVGNASVSIPVRLTVGNTPVENWRLTRFGSTSGAGIAADDANPDGDARVNLLEYAFDSLPSALDLPDTPIITSNNSGFLQIQFPRHTGRTDLRYLAEATSDLNGPWITLASSVHGAPTTSNGAHSVSETGAANIKIVTVEDSAPAASFTARYLRLRVVRD